jgi:hypothetical protein
MALVTPVETSNNLERLAEASPSRSITKAGLKNPIENQPPKGKQCTQATKETTQMQMTASGLCRSTRP